jgi:hypothetical protein
MLLSNNVFILHLQVNKKHFEDPSLLGCDPVTGLVFLNILKGHSFFTFRDSRRIVCLETPPPPSNPWIWRHCIPLKCQITVPMTQCHIPGYLNALKKKQFANLKSWITFYFILLSAAVSWFCDPPAVTHLLWHTIHNSHTCLCHFTVSCRLYLTNYIQLLHAHSNVSFWFRFLIKHFMHSIHS